MQQEKPTGRAVGGKARMASLSSEERKEIAARGAKAKAELAKLPKATHFGTLPFGDNLQCFVLNDGRRVISGRGMTEAIGMKGRGPGVVRIADHKLIRAYGDPKLIEAISNPIKFVGKNPKGNAETSDGFEAEVLGQVCEAILTARDNGLLATEQDYRYAQHADALMRGFARVGLVALIDEATGYSRPLSPANCDLGCPPSHQSSTSGCTSYITCPGLPKSLMHAPASSVTSRTT